MPKKLNEAERIGQRIILWDRAGKMFVPAICVVCRRRKEVKRSTALVWRSNKDAPACCARTAPHLVRRIQELEKAIAASAAHMEAGDLYEAKCKLDEALGSQRTS